ncbi:MAG TPA: cytochrome C oxidase subunit I, partial [Chitinophagaceae bacterium]|nr:cytochrome C oxidase subunit I [Chitinophagaceae bacterium]
ASRLIPMFLISKYTNPTILWIIFWLINTALISFIIIFFYLPLSYTLIPDYLLFVAIVLFIYYCYNAYKQRIRKQVDEQVKLSLLSTVLMLLPILLLFIIIILFINSSAENYQPMVAYGFMIFFGWITAIILGMTFKTLPFIVWNKIYHQRSNKGKTPNPKDLFSNTIFKIMSIAYILGIVIFLLGLVFENAILLKFGAFFILVTSILYNWNVLKIVYHKPTTT